ncbi:MAG: T9SS type A sorting domain-containing protein [Reichenbachiella sp.]
MKQLLPFFIITLCLTGSIHAQEARLYGVSDQNKIYKLNPTNGDVLAELSINTDPAYEEGLAFSGDYVFYVNGKGLREIIVIDKDLTGIVDTIDYKFPARVDGLAINGNTMYVFDFVAKQIMAYNLSTGIIDKIYLFPFNIIGGIAWSGNRNTLFVSGDFFTGEKRIYEVDLETGEIVNTLETAYAAFGLSYSNKLDLLFMTSASFESNNKVYAIDPETGLITSTFSGAYSAFASDESSTPIGDDFLTVVPDNDQTLPESTIISEKKTEVTLNTNTYNAENTIYPNPTVDGKVKIKFTSKELKTLNIYTLSGHKVGSHSTSKNFLELDLSHLQTGTYIIEQLETTTISRSKIQLH